MLRKAMEENPYYPYRTKEELENSQFFKEIKELTEAYFNE